MRKYLLVLHALVIPAIAFAQDNELLKNETKVTVGASSYHIANSQKAVRIHAYSNTGATIGLENRLILKRPLYLSNTLDLAYWNHSVYGYYSDNVPGNYVYGNHSLNNYGIEYKPAFIFPIRINDFVVFTGIGMRIRFLFYSEGNIYDLQGNYKEKNSGYHIGFRNSQPFRNNFKWFDHFAISLQHPKLRKFSMKLEGDNLFDSFLPQISPFHNEDFYSRTDLTYNYYNLNLKIGYRISDHLD